MSMSTDEQREIYQRVTTYLREVVEPELHIVPLIPDRIDTVISLSADPDGFADIMLTYYPQLRNIEDMHRQLHDYGVTLGRYLRADITDNARREERAIRDLILSEEEYERRLDFERREEERQQGTDRRNLELAEQEYEQVLEREFQERQVNEREQYARKHYGGLRKLLRLFDGSYERKQRIDEKALTTQQLGRLGEAERKILAKKSSQYAIAIELAGYGIPADRITELTEYISTGKVRRYEIGEGLAAEYAQWGLRDSVNWFLGVRGAQPPPRRQRAPQQQNRQV